MLGAERVKNSSGTSEINFGHQLPDLRLHSWWRCCHCRCSSSCPGRHSAACCSRTSCWWARVHQVHLLQHLQTEPCIQHWAPHLLQNRPEDNNYFMLKQTYMTWSQFHKPGIKFVYENPIPFLKGNNYQMADAK